MIILYPTDTVYGLGVDATDVHAVRDLIALKGREIGKPISIAVADMLMAAQYAVVTPLARQLADKFLPGPLTLVLDARDTLPTELTAGTGTIGIRIIDHEVPRRLIKELSAPITATSANKAGMPTMLNVSQILDQFRERADLITRVIDVGPLSASLPSTVVDVRGEVPIILREGAIAASALL